MRQFTRKILPVDTSEEAKKTLMETDEFSGRHLISWSALTLLAHK